MQAALRLLILSALFSVGTVSAEILDQLSFGDAVSESTHALTESHTEVLKGTLEESARRMLPVEKSWKGGSLSFRIKVDPKKQNYFTVRLSGDEVNPNQMILRVDGKQIGYRHLGEIEILDLGGDFPSYPGRFLYRTCPLPLALTRGKTSISCEILSLGTIWGYGKTFERMQQPMAGASRSLYGVYTHTDGCFMPPAGEKQGSLPPEVPVRATPGPEVIDQAKAKVNALIDRLLANPVAALDPVEMNFLAKAYLTPWTHAAGKPQALDKILISLDRLYRGFVMSPRNAVAGQSAYVPPWHSSGEVISLLKKELSPRFDEEISNGLGKKITRREGFTRMLMHGRDWHRQNRRQYTNQSMANDLYGIYLTNRGIAVLTPSAALPEMQARKYLRESVGLDPWLGSEVDGKPVRNFGGSFYQFTKKGLTRELGYTGTYGEVTDWMSKIYDATRPSPGEPGDPALLQQLLKASKARLPFRYPTLDPQGNRAMILETTVGWRDGLSPGPVTYAQSPSWDGTPLEAAALTLDPQLVGSAQQMIEDHQYFPVVERKLRNQDYRATTALLQIPRQYETIMAQPKSKDRMPMSPDQPDFVFSDEQNGVVAIKNGDEILYASLYWRSRSGINFLARVHYLTPSMERIATVNQEIDYTPSGMEYTRLDWTSFGFDTGGPKAPAEFTSAHIGEKLPIGKIPFDVVYDPKQENLYGGRGDFYQLRYGNYLIAMNMSEGRTFDLQIPETTGNARDLVSRKAVKPGAMIKVEPQQTLVIYSKN